MPSALTAQDRPTVDDADRPGLPVRKEIVEGKIAQFMRHGYDAELQCAYLAVQQGEDLADRQKIEKLRYQAKLLAENSYASVRELRKELGAIIVALQEAENVDPAPAPAS